MVMLDKLTAVDPPPEHSKLPSRDLSAFVGSYENQLYGTFEVLLDKENLKIEA